MRILPSTHPRPLTRVTSPIPSLYHLEFSLKAATDIVGTAKFKGHIIPKIQVGIKAFSHEADVFAKVDVWAAVYLLAKAHASASVSGSKKTSRAIADHAYTPPYGVASRALDGLDGGVAKKATAGFTGSVIINAGVEVSGGVEIKDKTVIPFFKALAGLKADEPLGVGAKAGKAWQLFVVRLSLGLPSHLFSVAPNLLTCFVG